MRIKSGVTSGCQTPVRNTDLAYNHSGMHGGGVGMAALGVREGGRERTVRK